ncbi:hypothetical protein ACIQZB_37465 [Streptomyces sp. NPDC097727]|uniref:hypothetical protein n=1 Tax=Streptomyces sp. NPDC097727 TaxID=3366092 RepID=UPI0037FBFC9F
MLDSWLDWLALIAVVVGLLVWWWRSRLPTTSIEGISYETVLIAATISPFVTAFATKLGERLGTTVKIQRMPWRQRRRRRRRGAELVVARSFHRAITIEMGAGLSDEARLALIDLDVERPELWGHFLRWDEEAMAWIPVPNTPDGEGAN